MEKQIFKVGDKVYHFGFGWGNVIRYEAERMYSVIVNFFSPKMNVEFTNEGRFQFSDIQPTLSFTEYTLQGFSQERPIDWNDYKGEWGIFWDDGSFRLLAIFKEYHHNNKCRFEIKEGAKFENFKPLSDEMVKELELNETFKSR